MTNEDSILRCNNRQSQSHISYRSEERWNNTLCKTYTVSSVFCSSVESTELSIIPALNHQCISYFFRRTAYFNRSPTLTNSLWFISTTANGFAAFAGSLYETTDRPRADFFIVGLIVSIIGQIIMALYEIFKVDSSSGSRHADMRPKHSQLAISVLLPSPHESLNDATTLHLLSCVSNHTCMSLSLLVLSTQWSHPIHTL